MTDLMGMIHEIVRPLPNPIRDLLNDGQVPDRILTETVECGHVEDDADGRPVQCVFAGVADVAVFMDTGEHLWWCPAGHENGWTA